MCSATSRTSCTVDVFSHRWQDGGHKILLGSLEEAGLHTVNTGSVCSDQCHEELELLGCAGNHEYGAGNLIKKLTYVFISTFMYMYLLVVLVLVSRRYLMLHSTSAVLCDCRLVGCSEESRSTCPPNHLELLLHSLVLAKVWICMTFYVVLLCSYCYISISIAVGTARSHCTTKKPYGSWKNLEVLLPCVQAF